MPFRRLPDSDASRLTALDRAFAKYRLVLTPPAPAPAGTPAFSAALFTRLGAIRTPFQAAVTAAGRTQATQSSLTALVETASLGLRQLVSHFIQVFNLAIERGEFPAADRALYLLPVASVEVPDLASSDDLKTWAQRLITGEASRLAAHPGAKPMDLPNIAQIQSALTAYEALLDPHSTAKTANDDAEEAIAKLRPEADETIRKIWNDIEHTYEDDEPASLRRKAREYGVTYATRPGEAPDPGTEPDPTTPPAAPTEPTPPPVA